MYKTFLTLCKHLYKVTVGKDKELKFYTNVNKRVDFTYIFLVTIFLVTQRSTEERVVNCGSGERLRKVP